ncbi:MAG: FecCD family ABC transporter permease [Anaerovoracaceae bacterium]
MGKTNDTGLTVHDFHYENFRRRSRYTAVFAACIIAFLFIIILNVNTGDVHIPVRDIFRIILTKQGNEQYVDIIWRIRLPRIFMAAMLGGALSVSGFLLQTFFENPIAGPFVLGISSGAKMVVAVTMIVFIDQMKTVTSFTLIIAAFVGSLISTAFILAVSKKVHQMAALLVAGIMIGYICSAVTDFVVNFAKDSDVANLQHWSQGSFSGMDWPQVKITFIVVGITLALVIVMSKPIGAFQLGEAYAQSMGVNVKFFRVALIILSSILSATVTAFAGPISFVGIAVPFLVKQALNTSKPLIVIPATFLGGSVFCMACDLIARMAFSPMELSISTITSIFGAPVVIFMMISKRTRR